MNYNTPTDRLLQILVTLGQSGEAISAKELSEQLSQPLSSTYRHLKTLLRWGLAEENGQGRYLPGPTWMRRKACRLFWRKASKASKSPRTSAVLPRSALPVMP